MRLLRVVPALLLAACGQAGDLYLPPEAPQPAPEAAPPVAPADAPAQAPDKEREKK